MTWRRLAGEGAEAARIRARRSLPGHPAPGVQLTEELRHHYVLGSLVSAELQALSNVLVVLLVSHLL